MRNIEQTGTMYGEVVTLSQISKPAARKLFAVGKEIYLQSSNYNPIGVWSNAMPAVLDNEELKSCKEHYDWCKKGGYKLPVYDPTPEGEFEKTVDNFGWYNLDSERGNYVCYYKKL